MKTVRIFAVTAAAAACLVLASCSMAIPETVSVKTNATYTLSLGKFTQDITKYVSAFNLAGSTSDTISIYNYKPNDTDNYQQYIVVCSVLTMKPFEGVPQAGIDAINSTGTIPAPYSNLADSMTLDLNMKKLIASSSDSLLSSLAFKSIPAYITIQKPAALTVTGKITADTTTLADETSDFKTVSLSLPATANDDYTTDMSAETKAYGSDMTAIVNSWPESLPIAWDLTIGKKSGQNITTDDTISIMLYLVLPLNFNTTKQIDYNVSDMLGMDGTSDMFGRSSANNSQTEEYLNAIKNIKFSLTCANESGLSDTTKIIISSKAFTSDKVITLADDMSYTSFSKTEIENMLSSTYFPFSPSILIEIPNKSTILIPRKASLTLGASVIVDTDGTIQLTGGNN